MQIEFTMRGLLSVFFRQRRTFAATFLLIVLGGLTYLVFARTEYEAAGSLLVKFGHDDAAAEFSRLDNSPQIISQNDRRETMQSDMDILESHGLLLATVRDVGAEKLYPGITDRVAGVDRPEEAAIRELLKNDLTVKSSQQSNVIDVRFMNRDPNIAAQFVSRLFGLFITRQSEVFNKPQTDFIREQVKQASAKLERSQEELENFKAKNGISSMNAELEELLRQKGDAGSVSLESIDDAWARISDLQAEESRLRVTYLPDSPQVMRIHQSVQLAEKQLRQRQAELESRTDKAASKIDKRIAELEKQHKHYNDLARQVDLNEENYRKYEQRAEETRVSETLNQRNISSIAVVDEPVAPMKPARPRRLLILAICLLSGVVFGGGAALAFETFDQRFTTPAQIATLLEVPVMASFGTYSKG